MAPCWKKNTSSSGKPKKRFSRKKATVSSCVAELVMIRKGRAAPCARLMASTFSAWIWKSGLRLTGPTAYMPLGWSKPSRLPCPPATSRTAISPLRSACSPGIRTASR